MRTFLLLPLRIVIIPSLSVTTKFGGEIGWRGWEILIMALAGLVGRLMRFGKRTDEKPISGMMRMVDWADRMIGAEGMWTEIGPSHFIKHLTHCPLAKQLQLVPNCCTRLGTVMGRAAFRAYLPDIKFTYTIPQTLSKGDHICEYVLKVNG